MKKQSAPRKGGSPTACVVGRPVRQSGACTIWSAVVAETREYSCARVQVTHKVFDLVENKSRKCISHLARFVGDLSTKLWVGDELD